MAENKAYHNDDDDVGTLWRNIPTPTGGISGSLQWLSALRATEDKLEEKFGASKFMQHAEKVSKLPCKPFPAFWNDQEILQNYELTEEEEEDLKKMESTKSRKEFAAKELGRMQRNF